MHPGIPILLTVLVLAALARKKDGPSLADKPAPQTGTTVKWPAPLGPSATRQLLSKEAPKAVFYKGLPDVSLPAGYQWVRLQYNESGKSWRNPLRFVQYQYAAHWDLQSTFIEHYAIAVIDDGLEYYIAARPVPASRCCRVIQCAYADVDVGLFNMDADTDFRSTHLGGDPEAFRKAEGMPEDSTCLCTETERECFEALVPPSFDWPKAKTDKSTGFGLKNG